MSWWKSRGEPPKFIAPGYHKNADWISFDESRSINNNNVVEIKNKISVIIAISHQLLSQWGKSAMNDTTYPINRLKLNTYVFATDFLADWN